MVGQNEAGIRKFCSPRMGTTFPCALPRVPNSFPLSGSVVRVSLFRLGRKEGKRFRSGKGFRIESLGLEGFSAGLGGKTHLRMHTSIFSQFGGGFSGF
jgi:hypothetical protein